MIILLRFFLLAIVSVGTLIAGEPLGQTLPQSGTELPLDFDRRTGDLDVMIKGRNIRALVLYNRAGFFYVDGRPQGIYYEAMRVFEQFVNETLHTKQHIQVTFIPVRPEDAQAALLQGVGDVLAYAVGVTPDREKQVAFSIPIQTDVKQVLVTGKNFGQLTSLADMGGKKIYVNPLSTYYENLEKVNESLEKQGKPTILIKIADKNLLDEDLMEMVNAGILPATVTIQERAALWANVFPNIVTYPNVVVAQQEDLAFAMRKDSPKLKEMLDKFVKTHSVGTSFGNTIMRRYLQNTHWIKNPASEADIKKFNETVVFFKKYSSQYGFDYLMIVAQGYQESMLNQAARNHDAVGILQVDSRTAAAPPINIPDISTVENNIHAGVKVLRTIADTYLN